MSNTLTRADLARIFGGRSGAAAVHAARCTCGCCGIAKSHADELRSGNGGIVAKRD
jgi:hypothetical protein